MKERGGLPTLQAMLLAAVAILASAANSLLCRLALQQGIFDPTSFATIRLVSGAGCRPSEVGERQVPASQCQSPTWMACRPPRVYAAAYKAIGVPVCASAVFNFVPKTALAFHRALTDLTADESEQLAALIRQLGPHEV